VDGVGQTFKAYDLPDPSLDGQNNTSFHVLRQYKGYANEDPGEIQQQAVTGSVLIMLCLLSLAPLAVAISQLIVPAFFFAMRSCEYLSVPGERRTKLLCMRNVRFFLRRGELHHNDPRLSLADTVSILFEYQKRDERNETVTQHRTGDPLLCPMRMWATILQRVRSYPGTMDDTKVNTFHFEGKTTNIRGATALSHLRAAVRAIGKDKLGLGPDGMGLHSIHIGSAMAMYLGAVPVFTIVLIERWSSDAFLRYIWRQVQEFSTGVSAQMVQQPSFFTIPAAQIAMEDPRLPNHSQNLSFRSQCGFVSQSAPVPPHFALFT
jgi:hypothetical protein